MMDYYIAIYLTSAVQSNKTTPSNILHKKDKSENL